jgi:phosphoglycerate dehydrogenase-like enzyme
MEVIGWSQNLTAEKARAVGATAVRKEELFARADILSIHTLLSRRTRGLVNAEMIATMKPTAWLVNTSRAAIVDEPAILDALVQRRIAGFAVDVFDVEPLPPDHPFRTLDNVVATPHLGYVAESLYRTFFEDCVHNIVQWLDGQGSGPNLVVDKPGRDA